MNLIEIILLLFLVVDPFGNLVFVTAILKNLTARDYLLSVTRETILAFLILSIFAIMGSTLMDYLNIEKSSLRISGGIILFLISLKMIFKTSAAIFEDEYKHNPVLVPIAVPSIAGPSAMATVIILRTQEHILTGKILLAAAIVCLLTWFVFVIGHRVLSFLGGRGVNAMEKLMGLLLNLISVNMIMQGIREFQITA